MSTIMLVTDQEMPMIHSQMELKSQLHAQKDPTKTMTDKLLASIVQQDSIVMKRQPQMFLKPAQRDSSVLKVPLILNLAQ